MGFEVDLDELADVESELRGYAENGEDIAALAADALAAHAERIKICAESYSSKEEDNSTTMAAIQRRLDGK